MGVYAKPDANSGYWPYESLAAGLTVISPGASLISAHGSTCSLILTGRAITS